MFGAAPVAALRLRDARYADDDGDIVVALAFKFLLLRTMAIGRRRPDLKDSTLHQCHGEFEPSLDRGLVRTPDTPAAPARSTPSAVTVTTCFASSTCLDVDVGRAISAA
jgi:hypothetical protein